MGNTRRRRTVSTNGHGGEKYVEKDGKGVVHVPPGEGRSLWVVGDTYTSKATTENTDGALFVTEASVPPRGGPPPHVHRRTDEAFYVLEGELEILDGGRAFVAGAGSFVFIPKGTAHAFKNAGPETARMLAVMAPAGFEGFFEEAGRPAGEGTAPPPGPEDIEKGIAAAPKYDIEILPPKGKGTGGDERSGARG